MDIKCLIISMVMSVISPAWAYHGKGSVPLDVMEPQGDSPMFLPTQSIYEARVGDRVILECAVKSQGNHHVIWRRLADPNPLTVGHETFLPDDRIVPEHIPKKQQWNLVIKRVRLTDNGLYECQVSSTQRHLRHHVLLTIREREVQTTQRHRPDIKVTGDAYVEQNGRIYLICNATGLEHSPDDLDWFLDGNKLPNSDNGRVIIRKDVSLTSRTIISSLEIKEAQTSDTGNYVCRTSNMQIQNLMVTVLNGETSNVKRGTIPGQGEKPDGSKKTDRQTGSLKEGGSPIYRRTDTGGQRGGEGTASRDTGSYLRLIAANLAVLVVSHIYWMFPS